MITNSEQQGAPAAPCFFSRQRGFTLVELIACIVILGILAAVSAPAFVNNQIYTTRGYSDEIASSLRYAQRVAIASGCKVQVIVDAAGYRAWQQSTLAACNGAIAWTTPVFRPDGMVLAGATPAGVNVNPNTTLEFQAGGNLGGGSAAIAVGTFTVNIDANTGRVSVQ